MHAYIIEGPLENERHRIIQTYCDEWHVTPLDTIELLPEEESIGIEAVRRFCSRLTLTPINSPWTVGVIPDATALTVPAQQALLKTLEEPPPHVKLILGTPNAAHLLPTIMSRSHIIRIQQQAGDAENPVTVPALFALQKVSPGTLLLTMDHIAKSADDARVWMRDATIALQTFIETPGNTSGGRVQAAHLLRRVLLGRGLIEKNVTPKLVLDHIFLENP